ncbi:hypothetical protein HOD71_04345 [Candidatus Peribacteria bacterium]|jgi:hypothetical protein|nr:hypothetical protein [Candidatus Peribacteria bacterium]MBT4241094.1 hypothetical protein [Candidatus Peribacteria bacterium]MBT4474344.1 hypothetical protein [Candidatus Peribacteria bacterium]
MLSVTTFLALISVLGLGVLWLLTNDLYAADGSSASGGERFRLICGAIMAFLAGFLLLLGKTDYQTIHAVKTVKWGSSHYFSQTSHTVHDAPEAELSGDTVEITIPNGKWAQWIVVTIVLSEDGHDELESFCLPPSDQNEFSHSLLEKAKEIRVHYGNPEGPSASAIINGPMAEETEESLPDVSNSTSGTATTEPATSNPVLAAPAAVEPVPIETYEEVIAPAATAEPLATPTYTPASSTPSAAEPAPEEKTEEVEEEVEKEEENTPPTTTDTSA